MVPVPGAQRHVLWGRGVGTGAIAGAGIEAKPRRGGAREGAAEGGKATGF